MEIKTIEQLLQAAQKYDVKVPNWGTYRYNELDNGEEVFIEIWGGVSFCSYDCLNGYCNYCNCCNQVTPSQLLAKMASNGYELVE